MQTTSILPQPHRDLSALSWEMMRIFLAVSRTRSLSLAASSLAESQTVLSRKMQELEDSLATRLIARGGEQVRLTDEGRALRDYFEKLETETSLLTDAVNGAEARSFVGEHL